MSFEYVVAGLGNPGNKYEKTRHNIGFRSVELLAESLNASAWQEKNGASYCSTELRDLKLLILKPQLFMNESGPPIAKLVNFYRISTKNLIVVHDEIDLDPGRIQIKLGGGLAGHNGLRSIVSALGSKDFCRVRIGVGRPKDQTEVTNWVLRKFLSEEEEYLPSVLKRSVEAVETIIIDGLKTAQQRFN